MNLVYVPLLQLQRDLYETPRGFERFREYLRTMIDAQSGDLKLPLVAMNPMGKDHLPSFLDALLAIDADQVAARAVEEAQKQLEDEAGAYKVCVVVSDDKLGGWTNRHTTELGHRFHERAFYKRGWITGILWTSETYTPGKVREEVRECLFRAAYIQRHGEARTLRDMLAQEGFAMSLAGATTPVLDRDDLAYTREVLAAQLEKTDPATAIAALFGDEAARALGHLPLGVSPRAGLALALHDARTTAQPGSA
jgi:hypothetical protein